MFARLFQSSVDPADIDHVRRLFAEDVKPAFEAQPGCISMELFLNVRPSAGGLVEGVAISRWHTLEELERALASRDVRESQVRILQLLRVEPVTKTLENAG